MSDDCLTQDKRQQLIALWPQANAFFASQPKQIKWEPISPISQSSSLFLFYHVAGQTVAVDASFYLGHGSMGSVRLGITQQGGRLALKIKLEEINIDDQIEYTILKTLGRAVALETRPYQPPKNQWTHHWQPTHKKKYLLTQYLPGTELSHFLQQKSATLTARQKLQLALACAKEVAAIHAHKIVHADISARNFLIEENTDKLSLHLIDFGLARQLPQEKNAQDVLTEDMTGIPPAVCGFLVADKYYHYCFAVDIYLLGQCFADEMGLTDDLISRMCAAKPELRPDIAEVIAALNVLCNEV